MLNFCGIVVTILKMETGRKFSMSGINSGHHNLPTYEMSLKSGHHYLPTYQILMILDNVEFLRPFWKWRLLEICRCQESIRDIIIYPHMKWRWNRTMLNIWGIVAAILKMATGRNCSMSGINSGHHYLPTYQMTLISDNVEFVRW
jgi:putative Mn2+ efflux pump MntP